MKAKMKRRIISVVCAAGVLLNLVNLNALALSLPAETVLSQSVSDVKSGTYQYIPKAGAAPAEDTFYYSDAYFQDSSINLNAHLATMSMSLAFSTFEEQGASYVTDLYQQIGYGDIQIQDMNEVPTRDSIGTAIAHRNVNGQEIIAVAIRGSRYYSEWAANLTAGADGDIEGYAKPAEKVISRIKAYIADHGLQNVKLWITGYSRAGSVADLVGVYVNTHLSEFSTTQEDTFVYAFEPAACAESSDYYGNIFCYLNRNDIVGYVYPEAWGMHRNGVIVPLGEEKMLTAKKIRLMAETPVTDIGEVAAEDFLPEFIDFIAEELNREVYSGAFEDAVANLIEMFVSKKPDEWKPVTEYFKNDFLNAAKETDRYYYFLMTSLNAGILKHNSDKMYQQCTDELILLMDEVMEKVPSPLTEDELSVIKENLYPFLRGIGPLVVKDLVYQENTDYSELLPENYDNADYDPQTDEDYPIMTFAQYQAEQARIQAEEEEIRKNMTDYERGYEAGDKSEGWTAGYDDGCLNTPMASYQDMPEDAESYSEEYIKGFQQAYKDNYESGFALGLEEYERLASMTDADRGYEAGYSEGSSAAYQDAENGEEHYRESFDDTPVPADEDNPEMSEAYISAYKTGYEEGYDESFSSELAFQKLLAAEMPLYHVGTFLLNLTDILNQHHPQTNLELVKEMDSYYTEINGDQLTVSYYDAEAYERRTVRATLLNGSETELTEGWYAVTQDVTVDHAITLTGDVSLILVDGCNLNVDGEISGDHVFRVYGQSDEWGTLTASAISADSYQQNGGSIMLDTDAEYALEGKSSVSIIGGQFESKGGIRSDGTFTLGYSYADGYIMAGSYQAEQIVVLDFMEFWMPELPLDFMDGYAIECTLHLTENGKVQQPEKADFIGKLSYRLPILSETLNEDDIRYMQGKKLCPYIDYSGVTIYDESVDLFEIPETPARLTALTSDDFDFAMTEKADDRYVCEIQGKGNYSGKAEIELKVYSEEGQLADDETLLAWAEKDYQDKYDIEVTASVIEKEDGIITIKLTDNTGRQLETYQIDTASGTGTDSFDSEVNLPQTGNNALRDLVLMLGALLMSCLGVFTIRLSRRSKA